MYVICTLAEDEFIPFSYKFSYYNLKFIKSQHYLCKVNILINITGYMRRNWGLKL